MSNEITAIPQLLDLLELRQGYRHHRRHGLSKNYRPNHRQESRLRVGAQSQSGQAHEQVETWFELARVNDWAVVNYSYHKTVESHHHRTEIRQVWSVPEPLYPSYINSSNGRAEDGSDGGQ